MKRKYKKKTNILLVNITRLGDMLQATPTIAGMKMENPDCKITVVVEKQFEQICRILPHIDDVMSIDLGMTVRSLAQEGEGIIDAYEYLSEYVDGLKQKNFDFCLNMSSSAYTAMLLNLVGVERKGGWASDSEGNRIIASDWAKLFASSVFHQNRQLNSINLVDIFRCSADVEQHPHSLQVDVRDSDLEYARKLLGEAKFINTGPLIAVQAGASQGKRQWLPENFIRMINSLVNKHNARVVLTGSDKELNIINPIKAGVNSDNVFVAAGRTTVQQLSGVLKLSDILITGDTGPMHMSVAVGTPVVSMFLASALGFETGPYSEGNLVLQPVIGCGPCNPNKPCSKPDCHDCIEPEALAELTMMRVRGDVFRVPDGLVDPSKVIVYRSYFDEFGFCDFKAISSNEFDTLAPYRDAYRKLWLSDLGGFDISSEPAIRRRSLNVVDGFDGLVEVKACAEEGTKLIEELIGVIKDATAPARRLGEVSEKLAELDRMIEQLGYHHSPLGPLTRMFLFSKENIQGSEALDLASQMGRIYQDLARRSGILGAYYQQVS